MTYRFLEDEAIADIAVEIESKTLNGLFNEGALALFDVMCSLDKVKGKEERKIELENNNTEELFFDWLSELVFLKDRDGMVFNKFDVKIEKNKLKAKIYGEIINMKKHELRVDVKAVTYHLFEVKKTDKEWKAKVVFDI